MDNSLYRQLVGSLLYLTHSQTYLAYFVVIVDIYMYKPHDIHWNEEKWILHCVQVTRHFGVHYVVGSPLELVRFTDSDWDGDSIDRNSTSGYVFMLAHGPIFCSRKKKNTISLSSAKDNYKGVVNTTT